MRRQELPEGYTTRLAAIRLGLAAGVVLFAGVVVFLQVTREPEPGSDDELVVMLSLAHGAMAVAGWIACAALPRVLMGSIARAGLDQEQCWQQGLARFQGLELVRLIVLEGPALFGLVICLLGVLGGLMDGRPLIWANGLSALVFLAYVAAGFPTSDRVRTSLQRSLRQE